MRRIIAAPPRGGTSLTMGNETRLIGIATNREHCLRCLFEKFFETRGTSLRTVDFTKYHHQLPPLRATQGQSH